MNETIREAAGLLFGGDNELWQIIFTTLRMSLMSTAVSSILGIPLGILIGRRQFPGRGLLLRVFHTLMGLPPVLAGLIVFILFRSIGPFGRLKLMFSVAVMVIAQVLLITPVTVSLSASAAEAKSPLLHETARGLGLSRAKEVRLLLRECAGQLVSVVLMAFGRSIAEVGAVSLVGGNIQYKTRVMTTAILLEANRGDFTRALAVGVVLMLLALLVNVPAYTLQEKLR